MGDEPTGNLDYKSANKIMEILSNLNAEGATVVLITHDNAVAPPAINIINLCDGRIS